MKSATTKISTTITALTTAFETISWDRPGREDDGNLLPDVKMNKINNNKNNNDNNDNI